MTGHVGSTGPDAIPVPGESAVPPVGRVSATVVRMLLGQRLRQAREAARITPDEAAFHIRGSRSKISRLENGRIGCKVRDVADLLTCYQVTDPRARKSMLDLARRANEPGWWTKYDGVMAHWFQDYLSLEEVAGLIRCYELQFVHGLLQTPEYARAVTLINRATAPPAEVDQLVSLRIERQGLLTGQDPPRLWAVLDEAVLRRPVGDRGVMRRQVDRLLEISELPNVTVQVLPFALGTHAAAGGPFTLLRFSASDLPDVVYIEHLTSAVFLDQTADVAYYLGVMDGVSAIAPTPSATRVFLSQLRQDI